MIYFFQVFMLLYYLWNIYPCFESLQTSTFATLVSLQWSLQNMISLTIFDNSQDVKHILCVCYGKIII